MWKSQLEYDIAESRVWDQTSEDMKLMQDRAIAGITNPQKILDVLEVTKGVYAG